MSWVFIILLFLLLASGVGAIVSVLDFEEGEQDEDGTSRD